MSENLQIIINAKDSASHTISGVTKSLGGLRSSAARAGKTLLKGFAVGAGLGAAAVVGVGVAALKASNQFDLATKAIIIGTGASGDALAKMQAEVLSVAGSATGLGHDMKEIGATIAEVATRTGATGTALNGLSEDILKMTRLTGGDAVNATQKITRVMGDWGVSLADSGGLVNSLFAAGQTFGIGLDSLAGKLVQFGAPLRQMGFSLS